MKNSCHQDLYPTVAVHRHKRQIFVLKDLYRHIRFISIQIDGNTDRQTFLATITSYNHRRKLSVVVGLGFLTTPLRLLPLPSSFTLFLQCCCCSSLHRRQALILPPRQVILSLSSFRYMLYVNNINVSLIIISNIYYI